MANKDTLKKMWALLVESFPNAKLSEDKGKTTSLVYAKQLAHLDDELLEKATLQAIATHDFASLPTIAHILQCAAQIVAAQNNMPDAFSAWGEVYKALTRGSTRLPLPWTHPAIEVVVGQLGGLNYLRESDNLVADRARFIEAWGVIVDRGTQEVIRPPAVRGYIEGKRQGLQPAASYLQP